MYTYRSPRSAEKVFQW